MVISGDFKHAILDFNVAVFKQVVDCPTRNNWTIDLLHANVSDAYRVNPPTREVWLQPLYTPQSKGNRQEPNQSGDGPLRRKGKSLL